MDNHFWRLYALCDILVMVKSFEAASRPLIRMFNFLVLAGAKVLVCNCFGWLVQIDKLQLDWSEFDKQKPA